MLSTFFRWLDARTGLVSGLNILGSWTVPSGCGSCRLIPPMIAFAFFVQVVTGVFLWAFYSTANGAAWESVFYIQYLLPGGWLVRGIHHFSAQLLVLLLGIHFVLLVLRGRYRTPHEFTFWGAVVLLLFALASCLTADLLTWTFNGYSATRVRVAFLTMIPFIGGDLFKIVAGGPDFGTLTIPRFLVLHVFLFGFGGFAVMLFWRWCENRADGIDLAKGCPSSGESETGSNDDSVGKSVDAKKQAACGKAAPRPVSFWSCPAVRSAFAALLFMGITLLLVYQKPLVAHFRPELSTVETHLPREASLGAPLTAPADPPSKYDACRPEWSFRGLYQYSNYFPASKKFYAIFVIPTCLFGYIFLMPIVGRLRIGHYLNVVVVWVLLVSFCYLTYASYHHDYRDMSDESRKFRYAEARLEADSRRMVELALGPERIPPGGAVELMRHDPFIQGPALYEQHCLMCHPFEPLSLQDAETREFKPMAAHADYLPMLCDDKTAPNLYNPVSKEWISGWFERDRLRSEDYFANTKFLNGSMASYLTGAFRDNAEIFDDADAALEDLIDMLLDEARLDGPRKDASGISEDALMAIADYGCLDCHYFYDPETGAFDPATKPTTPTVDLRGYMSRQWMIDFIANPSAPRFYGPDAGAKSGNDRMLAYHLSEDEAILTREEIGLIVDWLRGHWRRPVLDHPSLKKTEAEETTESVGTAEPVDVSPEAAPAIP